MEDIVSISRACRPYCDAIERRDRRLSVQLRDSLASSAADTAEGSNSLGGLRRARYSNAAASMDESIAHLRSAEAFGYIGPVPAGLFEQMQTVVGTLVKNVRRGAPAQHGSAAHRRS